MKEQVRPPNRIRELRDAKGLSVRDLAAKTDEDFNTVSRMERGAQSLDFPRMRKFARALDVKLSELLNDEDVELRADDEGRAILAALDNIPRNDHALMIQTTEAIVRVIQALAAQRNAGALSGNPQLVAGLADVWNTWNDSQREQGLTMLRAAARVDGG